jgi:hypothetical protein
VSGAIFQAQIGTLVDTLSYGPVFILASSLHLISAAAVMVLIPRIQKIKRY